MAMTVKHFFDANTSTLSYVVSDDETAHCAIIDPVLDLDYASGTLSTDSEATILNIGNQSIRGIRREGTRGVV